MGETFGVATSIIDLIQLSAQITSFIHAYVGELPRAPNDIYQLVDELCSLDKTLMVLQHRLTTSQYSTRPKVKQLDPINAVIHGCHQGLLQIASGVKPIENRKFIGIMGYSRWPLKKKETRYHISMIGRQRGLCISIITSISYYSEVPSNFAPHDLRTGSPIPNSLSEGESTLDMEGDRKQVFSWLRCGDYKRHLDIRQQRLKQTGNWLLRHPEFQRWKDQRDFRLIWGCGIPGAGKTFLSSMVIDHLEFRASTENFGVAHIYFNYQDQEQQDPVYVLASLVEQLAHQHPSLSTNIESLCSDLEPTGEKPSINKLYSILLRVSESFRWVFLVFDALDECSQSHRRFLLPLFRRMEKDGGISVFVTSRPYPKDIQDFLRAAVKIDVYARGEDIGMYIQKKIDEDPRAKRLVRQGDCRDRIITELVESARGMFLLIPFHIDYICRQTSTKQILIALEKIRSENPSTVAERSLDPTYDRAMENIRRQRRSCVILATKIFSWLVRARRTLTLDELRTAVSIEPNQYRLNDLELPDKATVLEVCSSLVTIGEHSNTIRLTHYTVQEYLLRNSLLTGPGETNYHLAITCATYLSFDVFALGASSIQDRQKSYPFLSYAALYLSSHLRSCGDKTPANFSAILALAILKLLVSSGNISTYLQVLYAGRKYGEMPFWDSNRKDHLRLHIASAMGDHVVVRLLLEGANLSITDNNGWRVFYLAKTARGHEAVAKLLLSKADSDIHVIDDYGQTALHVAASEGNTTVVKLLLEKGLDLSTSDKDGKTALHIAALRGHEAVVRTLICNGADISALDVDGNAALFWAVSGGHEGVIRILIENGADISVVDCEGWELVPPAACKGHEAVVQALLGSYTGVWYGDTARCETLPRGHKMMALLPRVDNIGSSLFGTDKWALQRWRGSGSTPNVCPLPSNSTSSGSTPRALTGKTSISKYYTSDEEDEEDEEEILGMDGDSVDGDSTYFNSCSEFGSSWGIVSHASSNKGKRKAAEFPADSQQQSSFLGGPQNNSQGDGSSDPPDRRRRKRNARQPPTPSSTVGGPPYACPYYKNNAQGHPGCAKWNTMELHRVKEHCRRSHLKPLQCLRCSIFRTGDNGQMNTHLRDGDCERAIDFVPIESDDVEKGKALGRRALNWKQIYIILFPGCVENEIPCPYWEDHVNDLNTSAIGSGGFTLQARTEPTLGQPMNFSMDFILWYQRNMYPRFYFLWLEETRGGQLPVSPDREAIGGGGRSASDAHNNLLGQSEAGSSRVVTQQSQEHPPQQSYEDLLSDAMGPDTIQSEVQWTAAASNVNENCVPGYDDFGMWPNNSQNLDLTSSGYSNYFTPV